MKVVKDKKFKITAVLVVAVVSAFVMNAFAEVQPATARDGLDRGDRTKAEALYQNPSNLRSHHPKSKQSDCSSASGQHR